MTRQIQKIKQLLYIITLAVFSFFMAAQNVLAQDEWGLKETGQQTKLPNLTVPQFLGQIAGAALALAGSAFLFLIIYGGIILMTAHGNDKAVEKGKNIIIWAIIGAVILFSAYAITNLVFGLFTASAPAE